MVKLKYVVKIVAYIWSKLNIWSNESYSHFANIWSNMQQIYGQNSRRWPYIIVTDMTYLLVNWTDVTSAESQPESAFENKIRDRAHKRSFTRYVVSFMDPPPLGTWPSRSATIPPSQGWRAPLQSLLRRAGARD